MGINALFQKLEPSFAFFEVSAASPGVDYAGEYLTAVLAPNHVSHNFVCPSILSLYLLQRTGGFLCNQFKFALSYQLLDIGNTGQVVLWGIKFSPYLNVSVVLTHIAASPLRSADAAWI